jgi:uncharacterized UPF0160 family protein
MIIFILPVEWEHTKEGDNIETKKQFKRIGTHDGRFHADEVIATAILKEIFDVELVRTRDEKILGKLDIVYDVGGGEFDHHGLDKRYREDDIPYAACGLIWKSFGKDVIRFKNPDLKEEEIQSVFQNIDRNLMEGIDALDNGIRIDGGEIPIMHISSIISGFNPTWNSDKDEDIAFNEVVDVAGVILRNTINQRLSVLKSRGNVEKAFKKRKTKEILVLDRYCPYGEAIQDIDVNKEVLFVVYPRSDSYAMQTVRGQGGEDRKKLPKEWAGRRDAELAQITGVPDAVFCHTGRFIAVAKSYDGIMKLTKLAVEEPETVEAAGMLGLMRKVLGFIKR